MNLPNKLTILRIIMVPFFVFFMLAEFVPHRYLFALILFCAASYTDHLDGKIARRDNLITNFGKLMDPLADKILVVSALICMVRLDLASTVCVLLIMVREFAITSIRLLAVEQGRVIAANNWGKLKTVSQMVAIIAILLMQYVGTFVPAALPGMTLAGQVLIVIATFFTVVSGVIYIKDNRDVIKGSPGVAGAFHFLWLHWGCCLSLILPACLNIRFIVRHNIAVIHHHKIYSSRPLHTETVHACYGQRILWQNFHKLYLFPRL